MEKIGRNSLDFYFVTIPPAVCVYIRNLPQKTGKIQFLGKSFAFFCAETLSFSFYIWYNGEENNGFPFLEKKEKKIRLESE